MSLLISALVPNAYCPLSPGAVFHHTKYSRCDNRVFAKVGPGFALTLIVDVKVAVHVHLIIKQEGSATW